MSKGLKASTLCNFRDNSKAVVDSFDKDAVARINGLIDYDPTKTEPNTAFAAVVSELDKLHLCYNMSPHPSEVGVHPDNRGNRMVTKESRETKANGISVAGEVAFSVWRPAIAFRLRRL